MSTFHPLRIDTLLHGGVCSEEREAPSNPEASTANGNQVGLGTKFYLLQYLSLKISQNCFPGRITVVFFAGMPIFLLEVGISRFRPIFGSNSEVHFGLTFQVFWQDYGIFS